MPWSQPLMVVTTWTGSVQFLTAMNLNQYSIAAAQPGLAVERVLNLHLPVPLQEEQRDIANHIGVGTTHIDCAIAHARRQIELLHEYRTRLIADVVTGKLDVRQAVAQLPDESDKDEPTDEDGPIADNAGENPYGAIQLEEKREIESEVMT